MSYKGFWRIPMGKTAVATPSMPKSERTFDRPIIVEPGGRLYLSPGTTLFFKNPGDSIIVCVGGSLIANGRPDAPITFTSLGFDPDGDDTDSGKNYSNISDMIPDGEYSAGAEEVGAEQPSRGKTHGLWGGIWILGNGTAEQDMWIPLSSDDDRPIYQEGGETFTDYPRSRTAHSYQDVTGRAAVEWRVWDYSSLPYHYNNLHTRWHKPGLDPFESPLSPDANSPVPSDDGYGFKTWDEVGAVNKSIPFYWGRLSDV